jgi:signal transduction histidine kinase
MKTIHARLVVTLLAAGCLLLTLLAIVVYGRTRGLLTAQFDDGLRARSQALVSLLQWHERGVELDYKGEYMPEFEHRRGGFFFQVWIEETGRVLERSHSLKGDDLPRLAGSITAPQFSDFTLSDGRPTRAIGTRVGRVIESERNEIPHERNSPSTDSGAIVVIAGDTTALHARLQHLVIELIVGGALCLAIISFIVLHVSRRGLKPLDDVSHLAAGLDANSLDQRFPVNEMPGELAPITARFNNLLARLEQAFARERRFSSNVAHELRTPIAELLSLAEVGNRLASKNAAPHGFFTDAADIARRMNATVSNLLLLARCESGRHPVDSIPVQTGDLIEELFREACGDSGRDDLACECKPPAGNIQTDPAMFTRLCRILMENALAHTAPNGHVTIGGSDGEIIISNGPVELETTDLPYLFERFWRKDESRTDARHSGIGLALAAELSRLLGFKLAAALTPDRTFQMRILLSGS